MDYGRESLIDALAAQYVAGTLRGGARRRFETLLAGHPALRRAVAQWQARLLPLTQALPPEAPPPAVWPAIERRLWPEPAPAREPWWRALAFWRGASALASVTTVALALLLAHPSPQPAPVVVVLAATGAEGAPEARHVSFVASVSGDGSALVTRPIQPLPLAAGRVLELWALPPQGAPRSLGLISAQGSTVIRRDQAAQALLDASRTAGLAVSIEPPGGSPTGAPTGPVVFAGKLRS